MACEECNANTRHSPLCSKNTPEQIKEHLIVYFAEYQKTHQYLRKGRSDTDIRVKEAKKEAEFWKGKFFVVKEENNKLRKNNKL